MVNYACGLITNQKWKYFEWIVIIIVNKYFQTGQYFRNFRNQCRLSSVTLFGGYILLYLKCSVLVGKISCHGKRQTLLFLPQLTTSTTLLSMPWNFYSCTLCTCFFKDNHNHCHCSEIVIIIIKQLHRFMIFLLGKVATDLIALIIQYMYMQK